MPETITSHTPGPWVKVRGELVGSNGKKVVEYGSGIAIMCGGGSDPEHIANAAIRNAAPCAMALVGRVAALNPEAGEIGAGMLTQLVTEARRILERAQSEARV